MSLSAIAISTLYSVKLVATVIFFLIGLYFYLLVWLHVRRRDEMLARDAQLIAAWRPSALPLVTIQLPIYNEKTVVADLIDTIVNIDYPRDRLEIQVLDDSTDVTTQIAQELVDKYRNEGFDIALHRRPDRSGYKAGNLKAGHAKARGEFIAIFDADFRPPADFLRRTLPFFDDPRLACVQTLWQHYNQDRSTMTMAQGLALDGANYVVQSVQCWWGLMMHFQGTGGIWRKAAIDDAGGWRADTLTEDLDLSSRAYLRGWTMKYLPQVVCLGELPETISAAKAQMHRWTKGGIQVALKTLPDVLRSNMPMRVKIDNTVYMLSSLLQPCVFAIGLSWPAQLMLGLRMDDAGSLIPNGLLTAASLGSMLMMLYAMKQLRPDWPRRIHHYAYLCIWGLAISVTNTRAILEAFLGIKSGFVRTPRFRSLSGAALPQDRAERPRLTGQFWAELAILIYCVAGIFMLALQSHPVIDPFLMIFTAALAAGVGKTLRESLEWSAAARRDDAPPAATGPEPV